MYEVFSSAIFFAIMKSGAFISEFLCRRMAQLDDYDACWIYVLEEACAEWRSNMERRVGTISRGIRCPIIREGDDLTAIVVDSVLEAAASEGFSLHDRDVIAMTESIVARAQGNYASVDA